MHACPIHYLQLGTHIYAECIALSTMNAMHAFTYMYLSFGFGTVAFCIILIQTNRSGGAMIPVGED